MSAPLDFINVMTYDYHGWFGGDFPYTGHNSPMYALEEEMEEDHDYYGWNIDYAMNYWLDGGAEKEKLLVGIGTYGRGFRLTDPNNNGLYAPASGPQAAGPYTRQAGILGFNEWCEIKDGYTVVRVC